MTGCSDDNLRMTKLSQTTPRHLAIATCVLLALALVGLASADASSDANAPAPDTEATVAGSSAVEGAGGIHGIVIDGLCPAEIEPTTIEVVPSLFDRRGGYSVYGTPYDAQNVLTWSAPDVPGLTGYQIKRETLDPHESFRVVAEHNFNTGGEAEFSDSFNLTPDREYRYWIYPAVGTEFLDPYGPITLRARPSEPPPAPYRLLARHYQDAIGLETLYGNLIEVSTFRFLRRNSPDSAWELVEGENLNYGDYYRGRWSWVTDNQWGVEYAACLGNDKGFGRAVTRYVGLESHTQDVAPPSSVRALARSTRTTVFWEPSNDPRVIGYDVVRGTLPITDREDFERSDDRAQNYVTFRDGDPNQEQQFKVRSLTRSGHGPWSETVWYRPSDPPSSNADTLGIPRIVSASPSHAAVHLVFEVDGPLEDVRYGVLRRQVGEDRGWSTYQDYDWIDKDEFDWERAYEVYRIPWAYATNVQPDTEYEYAIQLLDGEELVGPSEPIRVKTRPVPDDPDRLPLPVTGLKAIETSSAIEITWELPDDPTITGILLTVTEWDYDVVGQFVHVLPATATRHLYVPRVYPDWYEVAPTYAFSVRTVNDHGATGSYRVSPKTSDTE